MTMRLVVSLGYIEDIKSLLDNVIFIFGLLSCDLNTGRLVELAIVAAKLLRWARSTSRLGPRVMLVVVSMIITVLVVEDFVPDVKGIIMLLSVIVIVVLVDALRV